MISTETQRFLKTWAKTFFYLSLVVASGFGGLYLIGLGLVAIHKVYGSDGVFLTLFGSMCLLGISLFSYFWAKTIIHKKDIEAQRTMDILRSERIYGGKAPKF